ncbi:sigma-70 family RNA polymerase sigma factor [Micromonospora sp. WMMD882]|uniref:RNA polymerase sigma factor n=1 Tax=Micromonospora sp. WMMD882 TaxID=3015151 RepID=UPI00248C2001|nr:sigma-70 family RNA polymerase sigma factor [Micromonospora sp. WMMD882]WBB77687.1 sigma-70 family RNA polymerase sigma factor [Micromonospora sp. WMMD882]
MEGSDEGELVRRVARGDRRAFDELYRRTAPWLEVRLRRRCADPDVVAEVLQDTYLTVWRAAGSFAGVRGGGAKGSAVGWLWTIAAHRLVDAFRRRARRAQTPQAPLMPSTAPAAEDEVMATRIGQELEQALLVLPPEVRAALRATVLDGLSPREASVLLGVPENTVKSRVRRARIALREALS